jgi:hypothetical protein
LAFRCYVFGGHSFQLFPVTASRGRHARITVRYVCGQFPAVSLPPRAAVTHVSPSVMYVDSFQLFPVTASQGRHARITVRYVCGQNSAHTEDDASFPTRDCDVTENFHPPYRRRSLYHIISSLYFSMHYSTS